MPTALVTGATAGLGRELAEQLAEAGHDLVLVARTTDRLERATEEIRGRHRVHVEVLTADLTDRDALAAVADRVADPDRPVDVLVNNAGFGLGSPFDRTTLAQEEALLDALVRAPMVLSHAAVGAMTARGRGRVVNISSVAGFMASGSYAAAKSYLTVLTESLAGQLAGSLPAGFAAAGVASAAGPAALAVLSSPLLLANTLPAVAAVTLVLGFGAAALLPDITEAGATGNLASPLLAREVGGGAGSFGGAILLALITIVVFVAAVARL